MSHPVYSPNPYPALPPLLAHKVWILDCKNCRMFLTNRGMKAVLLLRPNVSLYSSDALPVNCSPDNSNSDALWSPTAYKSSRTCECLTQSLCCHGCGNAIGYMIIVPCSRCTFSLSETNRATNGHRFVFQSSEVLGTERHYVSNEKGVIPFDINPYTYPTQQSNLYHNDDPADSYEQAESLSTAPALEYTNILDYSQQQPFGHDSWAYSDRPSSFSPREARIPRYHSSNHATSSTDVQRHFPPVSPDPSYTADQKYAPTAPYILKAGDVIFWHHLAWSGEILEVVDDERARRPAEATGGGVDFDR